MITTCMNHQTIASRPPHAEMAAGYWLLIIACLDMGPLRSHCMGMHACILDCWDCSSALGFDLITMIIMIVVHGWSCVTRIHFCVYYYITSTSTILIILTTSKWRMRSGWQTLCTQCNDCTPPMHSWFRCIFYECCDWVNVYVHASIDQISLRSSVWSAKRWYHWWYMHIRYKDINKKCIWLTFINMLCNSCRLTSRPGGADVTVTTYHLVCTW